MIHWLTQLFTAFKTLILLGLGVIVLFAIAETFHKTRSVVGSVVVLVLGAGLIWGASNITVISTKVGNDVNNPGALIAPGGRPAPNAVALARSGPANPVLIVYRGGDR